MQNALLQIRSDSQKKPYRWPQKVHRYGLMNDSFLRLFVALYENKVPWNTRPNGWCAESLREHIRTEMLPALKPVPPKGSAGTPFGDAFYLRRINLNAALHEAGNSYLESLKIERDHNPQSAEQKAIGYFNREKHAAFKDWWRMMNEHYREYPEWIYCVLKRMFATSDRDSRAPVPPVRLATVEKLTEAVVQGHISPSVGLSGIYLLMDAGMDTDQSRHNENGWTRVAIDDPRSSLKQKINLLAYFGNRARWCIANPTVASNYLSESDFYVLCVAGAPRVAIRWRNKSSGDSSSLCVEGVTGVSNRSVVKNAAVDLLIAVLKEKTRIQENERLQTGSTLSCLNLDGWKRVLEAVPFALHLAPNPVRRSNSIRENTYAAKLRYILHDPFWITYSLREPSGFESLGGHMEDTLASALRRMPMPVRYLGKALLRHPRLRTAWEEGWIQHLKEKATTLDVPRRILASPEIRPLARDAFQIDLACAPIPPRFHAFYQEDPGLLEEYRKAWIRYLQQTKNPAAQVPKRFWNDKQIVSAWSAAHVDDAKRGIAPKNGASAGMMREAWCGLWIVALKAIFATPGQSAYHMDIPKEILTRPVIQDTLFAGWLSCLQNQIEKKVWFHSGKSTESLFTTVLQQIREGFGSSRTMRDFVLRYLRMTARLGQFPWFNTLSAEKESDPIKQFVLQEFATESEFQELWLEGWQKATVARLHALSKGCTWEFFFVPEVVAALPEVRSAAVEAYIAFLREAVASQNPGHKPAIVDSASLSTLATADVETHPATGFSRGNSAGCDPRSKPAATSTTAPTAQSAIPALAAKTAAAFFERLALHGNALGLEIPPAEIAENPTLSREWSQQWPQEVVDRIPVENLSHVLGCTDLRIPAAVWEQPAGRLVHRELVLRFLATRGAGRPLATNDALPKAFANAPDMQEIWIAAWERVLRAMPQHYAVFRRVALHVQHSPRVFWAWLQAVRPLNRLLEEEEAWRTFLLLNRGDVFPPFLPRLEIWLRNSKLRGLVREALQYRGTPHHAPDHAKGNDFVTTGMFSRLGRVPDQQAWNAAFALEGFEAVHEGLLRADIRGAQSGHPGLRDAEDAAPLEQARGALRDAPWMLEWLPPAFSQHPILEDAVLSGWESYLGAAPWLLPWVPAACRRHFGKTRSGIKRAGKPPEHPPTKRLPAAA